MSFAAIVIGGVMAYSLIENSSFFSILVLIVTLVISSILYIIARLVYEVASILADLADSTLDLNCRYETQETEDHGIGVS